MHIGRLFWWTNEKDIINALASIGVTDIDDLVFHVGHKSGLNLGAATIIVKSVASVNTIMEELIKIPVDVKEDPTRVYAVCEAKSMDVANFAAMCSREAPTLAPISAPPRNSQRPPVSVCVRCVLFLWLGSRRSGLDANGLPLHGPSRIQSHAVLHVR